MLLKLFLTAAAVAGADPVKQNLQAPPASVTNSSPTLHSSLTIADGVRSTSRPDWERQRASIKRQWQVVLGEMPTRRPALEPKVLSTEHLLDFDRSYVKYETERGVWTDGYLLMPKPTAKKCAAVVVFHPTTPSQAKGVAGVDDAYPADKRQGLQLVGRGFVVWCPRNYINSPGADWPGNAKRVMAQHPGWTGMTRMLWDAIRAADFLATLPQVDTNRIGCIGHSLGAKVVLYAMAFDERYKAGVFSEGGIGLKFSNWDASWYLGSRIRGKGFRLEHDELLALIAPRAFLLLAGDSADGDRSWEFIHAAMPVYKLLGAPDNIGWWNHHQGHAYPSEGREIAETFLIRYLMRSE